MGNFDWSDLVALLFLLFLIFVVVVPSLGRASLMRKRQSTLRGIEVKRRSRLIVLIHRQESVSFLGVPISRYIDIDDSEQILRAIRLTKPDVPIDLIVHTPGGLVLAAEQIANALIRHEAPVTVMVPHYAMSGGTLLALAADEIVMDPNAVLGPVDPQLGGMPAAGFTELLQQKPLASISDQSFIVAGMAEKALRQVRRTVVRLLTTNGMEADRADYLAEVLSTGRYTHDYAITFEEAQELGLNVSDALPQEVYQLMELYPQSGKNRPSVQYIPLPYRRANEEAPKS